MTVDASWGLHRAILAALREDKAVLACVGGPEAIGDESRRPCGDGPQGKDGEKICGQGGEHGGRENGKKDQAHPSIKLGASSTACWHSATFDGQEHTLTLDLESPKGDMAVRQMAAAVIERLHDADLLIPGHALIELQFECSETHAPDAQGITHCRMFFKALTVSD
ncbi:hypothetical protein JCM17845_29060 [Iodidimonas gelatinilytica]|uniref:DUF3168 domain-containing protein n=1 Tax=Iodidimonas gelatinilytica TaxID=1236966 RepID=A0A5A7N1Y8_9PROT|nr:DUF3168 domain-containing protein [Iodidimonas gelatinilytica]GER02283.1 hypothetical protein JCM17845_29060 [Iodidimonas gelatinilytica]